MPNILRPFSDIAPHLPRRNVKVSVAGLGGNMVPPGVNPTVALQLVGDIHVPTDGVVVAAAGRIVIDVSSGDTTVALPVYDGTIGGQWGILVTKSWAPYSYLTRVPPGGGAISLADLPALSTLESAEDLAGGGSGESAYRAITLPTGGKPGNVLGLGPSGGIQWQDVAASLMQRSTRWQFVPGQDFKDVSPTPLASTKYHAFPSGCLLDDGNILVSVSSYTDHFGGKEGDKSLFAVFNTDGNKVSADWREVPQNPAGKTSVADLCNGGDGYVYACLMTTSPYSLIVARVEATTAGVEKLTDGSIQKQIPSNSWNSNWTAGPFPCATFATPANPAKGYKARIWMVGYWEGSNHFMYSEDQGATWHKGPQGVWSGINESAFSVSGDKVVALVRQETETDGGGIWEAVSNDGGRTWGNITKVLPRLSGLPRHTIMQDGSRLVGLRDLNSGETWVYAQKAPELNGVTSWWESARAPLIGRMMYGFFLPVTRGGKPAGIWFGAGMSAIRSGVCRLYVRLLEQAPAQYYDVVGLPEAVSQAMDSWKAYKPSIISVDGDVLSLGVTPVGAYRQIGRQREVWAYVPSGASNATGKRILLKLPDDFAPVESSALVANASGEKVGGARFIANGLLQLLRHNGESATGADLGNAGGISIRVVWEQAGPKPGNPGGIIGR